MRRTGIALTVIITSALQANARTKDDDHVKEALVGISQTLLNSISTGDSSVWNTYLLENCTFVTEEGKSNTKSEMVSSIVPLPRGFSGNIKVTGPTISTYSNTAVLNYIAKEYEKVFDQEVNTEYCIAETYVKTLEGWRILSGQVFEIPQHPKPVDVDLSILQHYTGTYLLGDDITYEVSLEHGKLFGQRKGRPREELFAENDTMFFTLQDARGVKVFETRGAGGASRMIARRNGNDIVWKKVK